MTSPPIPSDTDYRYVVLGPEGVPVVRVITAAAQCPALDVDGAAIAMTVRMPAETIPVRPSRPDLPPPKPSVFPVMTCEATLPVNAQRASVAGQSLPLPKAAPSAHRGARRHRLPRSADGQRLPVVRRPVRVAVRARCERRGRRRARSRHPRRRLPLSRRPVRPRASRLLRQPVGLRLRRMARRFLPAGAQAARRGAVDRGARQPRVVQSRRAGLVPVPRSASRRAAAELQSRGGRRHRQLQRVLRRAARP